MAGLGSRCLAALVDAIGLAILLLLWVLLCAVLAMWASRSVDSSRKRGIASQQK